MNKQSKSSLRDRLTATTNEGKIELAEGMVVRYTEPCWSDLPGNQQSRAI